MTTPNVRPRSTQVLKDLGLSAAGVEQGVG
jgi:hypothetical protein